MSKVNSTSSKPDRPDGSPLFWHPSGRWCKKIKGKQHYFGRGDHASALAVYNAQKEDLHAGRLPQEEPEGLTVQKLYAKFLASKWTRRELGYLSPRTYRDYEGVCQLTQKAFGKHRLVADLRPEDFERLLRTIAKGWGPVRVANTVIRVRMIFKFGVKQGVIDRVPNYGEGFDPPPQKVLRLERAKRGPKLFSPEEIRGLLSAASPQLKAMILLGINCGLGNADCGRLPLSAIDLETGWLNYPRGKSGAARRCALWPETVEAIRQALAIRPEPANEADAGLVFLTRYGNSWYRDIPGGPVTVEFGKAARKAGIKGRRGFGFYGLRHTLRTQADSCLDQPAIDLIMGHCKHDMASLFYRHGIEDARLRRVTDHVRQWLFPPEKTEAPDILQLPQANIG
jgi:integrase